MFLINSGKYGFSFRFLAIVRKQQENTGQALLTGVEKLIDQILLIPHVANQQVGDEQFRDVVLFVEKAHHQRLFDPVKRAIGQGCGSGHAQWPPGTMRSALNRATRKAGRTVATASDASFLYIWNVTEST
jgi:hypothetical protein